MKSLAARDSPALPFALLFAAAAGTLDAIIYVNHGQLFASAVSGNVVTLGVSVVTADWPKILPHLSPIAAYVAGVAASRLLRTLKAPHLERLTLAIEIVTLAVAGMMPAGFPAEAFTALVAFACALQVASFRRVGQFSYSSTFITGDLRDSIEGLFGWRLERDAEERAKAREKFARLGAVCLVFLLAAAFGAWVAVHDRAHDIWWAEPPLLVAFALTLRYPEALKVQGTF